MLQGVRQILRPPPTPFLRNKGDARVLLFSMRRVADLAAYCVLYEFEDMVMDWAACDRVEPERLEGLDLLRKIYKAGRAITGSTEAARWVTPRPRGLRLEREYDLFLPVFNNPFEIFALSAVPEWRKRCRYAACYVSELWEGQIPEYLVEQLRHFDHIYLGVTRPVATVARITGRPCSYLPLGVDSLLFAPRLDAPRPIHVCSPGRRSEVTHRALLDMARERGLFYYFDTMGSRGVVNPSRQITFSVPRPREHRFLYATLLKNSRFFMASRARANEPEVTRGVEEIAGRFFEGAAAGAVMIGEPPRNEVFDAYFDWPDAVIRTPFDEPRIAEVLDALEADPARLARIRRDAVAGTLRKTDWVHRLRAIFEAAGLPPTVAMLEREARLRSLADSIRAGGS